MPSLTGNRRNIIRNFILSLHPVAYFPLWKRDGNIIVSEDAVGRKSTVTGALWTARGRYFDAVDDSIDTASDWIGTQAISFFGYARPSVIDGAGRTLFHNGRTYAILSPTNYRIAFTSNNSDGAFSADNSILVTGKETTYYFMITRTAAGVANIYVGTNKYKPELSGSANQNSGTTPLAGTGNVLIGNNAAGTNPFGGTIGEIIAVPGIVSESNFLTYWNLTKDTVTG